VEIRHRAVDFLCLRVQVFYTSSIVLESTWASQKFASLLALLRLLFQEVTQRHRQ